MICSDKTGTLTQNEMTAVKLWVHHTEVDISGQGYQPEGRFTHSKANRELDVQSDVEVAGLLWAAALVNDARWKKRANRKDKITYRMVGDPTEGALIVAAAKAGLVAIGHRAELSARGRSAVRFGSQTHEHHSRTQARHDG